jgi:hypothetical protein
MTVKRPMSVSAVAYVAPDDWTEFTPDQARAVTEAIKHHAEQLYELLYQAWSRKAWKALGYASFAAYVQTEFAMTRQRAYQLLDQARIVEAISAAATTPVDIPEAAARDLKPVLPQVIEHIRAKLGGAPPDEAEAITAEVIEDVRTYRRLHRQMQERMRRWELDAPRRREAFEARNRAGRQLGPEPGGDRHEWQPQPSDDRGLSLVDAAVLDAHHHAWAALGVLQDLELERLGTVLTAAEREEYAKRANLLQAWLDRYRATLATAGSQ